MLRGALVAFVLGWVSWFWIDKNPATLGPLPMPTDGAYLQNFQVGVDLVKQGRYRAAFVYIWKAHFIVLSLGIGLLLGAALNAVARRLSRNRLLRLYLPDRKAERKQE